MSNNDVIHVVVAVHASFASIALGLGAWQLWHRPRGDRAHRMVGRVWVAAMYLMLATAFFVAPVHITRPNIFQVLAVFTLGTLTIGLRAAVSGDVARHRGFMIGTYSGLVGAFIGAVAVPQRDIPTLIVHRPAVFVLTVLGLLGVMVGIVVACSRPGLSDRERRVPSRVTSPSRG